MNIKDNKSKSLKAKPSENTVVNKIAESQKYTLNEQVGKLNNLMNQK